ncbi:hypothetical protein [Novosphingopyxis sp.]|uniref:hypothetical protein n=1 Tax=Novosphingopyxis sp. TaxID=2709690 RepID=UPI003B5C30C3
MARSVSYPTGAIVAYQLFEPENEGDWDWEFCDFVEHITDTAREKFPSLEPNEGWRGREDRILLRNAYADFGISIYGGLAAIWIAERDDGRYWDHDAETPRSGRAQHWLSLIEARFLKLFSRYRRVGRFSNGEAIYQAISA